MNPAFPPRLTRRLRLAALALGAVVALYGVLLVVLTRDSVEAALRTRIESALRARLGTEVSLGPEVHVDPLLRVTFGPVTVAGSRPGDPPLFRVERVKVRPRLLALFSARLELASARLYGARVELPRRDNPLREVAERLRRPPRRGTAGAQPGTETSAAGDEDPVPIQVRNLVVAFEVAGREVEVGPLQLAAVRERSPGGSRLRLDLRLADDGSAALDVRRDATGWHGTLHVAGVGPAVLGTRPAEDAPPPAAPATGRPAASRATATAVDAAAWRGPPVAPVPPGWTGGRLGFTAQGDAAPDLSSAQATLSAEAEAIVVQGDAIAPTPVGPLSARLEGILAWDGDERRISLREARATALGALLVLDGEARLGPGVPFTFSARAEDVDYAALVAALPGALAPPADAPRPAGTFDAHLALAGPLQAPAVWTVDAGLDLSRMREAARRAPPVKLRGTFVHHPTVEDGKPPTLTVGPPGPDFVPIAELPPYVVRAVTASEDGGFFGHQGFDFDELRNAVAQGAADGKRMRGGSTISQQLAKNLYLSRSRTLARKIREAIITIGLEASVPKSRLMEIYLNIVEWGPNLWGIGPAARHWFGKDAQQLSPREAAFLASVIPNPVRFHFMWSRGATTQGWDARVDRLLERMAEQGSITPEELAAGLAEKTVFASPAAAAAQPAEPEPVLGPEDFFPSDR